MEMHFIGPGIEASTSLYKYTALPFYGVMQYMSVASYTSVAKEENCPTQTYLAHKLNNTCQSDGYMSQQFNEVQYSPWLLYVRWGGDLLGIPTGP